MPQITVVRPLPASVVSQPVQNENVFSGKKTKLAESLRLVNLSPEKNTVKVGQGCRDPLNQELKQSLTTMLHKNKCCYSTGRKNATPAMSVSIAAESSWPWTATYKSVGKTKNEAGDSVMNRSATGEKGYLVNGAAMLPMLRLKGGGNTRLSEKRPPESNIDTNSVSLMNLPHEMMLNIADHLSLEDLLSLSKVSPILNRLLKKKIIMRKKIEIEKILSSPLSKRDASSLLI